MNPDAYHPKGFFSEGSNELIGSKTFTDEDQISFAELSNDYNPIHMDKVLSRRLLSGRRVVHGMNLLLHAMEYFLRKSSLVPSSITCTFNSPVSIGDLVIFTCATKSSKVNVITLTIEGVICAKITLNTSSIGKQINNSKVQHYPPATISNVSRTTKPIDSCSQNHIGKNYCID